MKNLKEQWKNIKGYEGLYEISNHGRLKSHHTRSAGRILKPIYGKYYQKIILSLNGKQSTYNSHVLVWDHFTDDDRTGYHVDHIDEDKHNNRIDNLQLLTHRENLSKGRHKFNKSSKYVGVKAYKGIKKTTWSAQIQLDGKTIYLGTFHSEFEAHLRYQKSLLNFLIKK